MAKVIGAERTCSSPVDRVLGAQVGNLLAVVRRFHTGRGDVVGEGTLVVVQSASLVGRWVAHRVGLPRAAGETPVRLVIRRSARPRGLAPDAPPRERWQRSFGREALTSTLTADGDVLVERVGRIELRYRLQVGDGQLVFDHVGTRARLGGLGVPLPRWLTPKVVARVGAAPTGDQLDVRVQITSPVLGTLLAYGGRLIPREVP